MSLIVLPTSTDAFSEYKPSQNAHTDFLGPSTLGKRKEGEKGGARVIKLERPPTIRPQEAASDPRSDLITAIVAILNGKPCPTSYHHLSATLHRLLLQSQSRLSSTAVSRVKSQPAPTVAEEIYRKMEEEMKKTIAGFAREWRGTIMSREEGWLKRLVAGWKIWESRVNLLGAVFVYLDRLYAASTPNVFTIKEMSNNAFLEGIFENDILQTKTRDDVLNWAAAERSSLQPDTALRPTITSLLGLLRVLGIFSLISDPYIEALIEHYDTTAASNVESVESGTMSAGRYVQWVREKVLEEKDRAEECFGTDRGVAEQAVASVREYAGAKQQERFMRRALDEAMVLSDEAALGELYKLAVDCSIFPRFKNALQANIDQRLRKLISDRANDPQMIEGTLNLKRFADKAVSGLLAKEDAKVAEDELEVPLQSLTVQEQDRQIELEDAVRSGLKQGLGSRQNAPAEWIAKHLDVVMRRGQGQGTEAEFNALLDEIIALIGFTPDKDVFKAFYSTQLAKRLLLNKSASDDMERNMILKLQNEMGEEFTSGDIMMKDLALSETLVKSYQSAQSKNPEQFRDPGNFTANVLTESAWPAYPMLKDGWNFTLTPELQTSIEQFTTWYSTQHKNRQLSWRWQLATVSLTARFPSGRYEIGLSLFQAVVLLQYNHEESFTFTELKERTGIEQSELVRCVQSLSMGRKGTRVLVKRPAGKEVAPTDNFIWNKQFTSDRIKFRINQIQQDMSAEESKKTNEQVAVDRVSVLEATIVRIMKARKKMTMQLLVDGVVVDVSKRFPPDVKEIKKRMESLIEREFLMRDEDDRNLLHYLA